MRLFVSSLLEVIIEYKTSDGTAKNRHDNAAYNGYVRPNHIHGFTSRFLVGFGRKLARVFGFNNFSGADRLAAPLPPGGPVGRVAFYVGGGGRLGLDGFGHAPAAAFAGAAA